MPGMGSQGGLVDGRFVLAEQLSVGGVGEVWRARDRYRGDDVTVQLLPVPREVEVRFGHTAAALAGLDCPHLAAVRCHGATDPTGRDGCGFLLLAPLPGRTLGELQAAQGWIGRRRALAVVEQVGIALAAVHAAGLVHGSLQPACVLVDEDDVGAPAVTVLDAGLADFVPEARAEGGVLYRAPERNDGAPATPAGDLYALGALLYELLVGRPPYVGTVGEVVERHRQALPLRPSRVRDLPVGVDDLVFELMAREPADRPASAAEVAAAMAGLRAGAPSSAVSASLPQAPHADSGQGEHWPRAVVPLAAKLAPPAEVAPAAPPAGAPRKKGRGRLRWVLAVGAALLLAVGGVAGYLTLTAYDQAEVEHAIERAVQQLNSSASNREVPLAEAAEQALDSESGWLRLRTSEAHPRGFSNPEGEAVAIEVTNLLGQHPVCLVLTEVAGPAVIALDRPGRC